MLDRIPKGRFKDSESKGAHSVWLPLCYAWQMEMVKQNLVNWQESLIESIPLPGLLSRNPVVYKWKAPFRCWLLREGTFWRATDLLTQSYALHAQGHGLGARILLRSGFETLASLVHLNQLIQQVLENRLDFHQFSEQTRILLLGSRNGSTPLSALNIMTILHKCDKRYPGLEKLYGTLSESAHPNYEGILAGYSEVDHESAETHFSNRWMDKYGGSHVNSIDLCMTIFNYEYEELWPDLIEKLEAWIVENDARLEETKDEVAQD